MSQDQKQFELICNYHHIKQMFSLVPFVSTSRERFFIATEIGETSTRIQKLRESFIDA